MTLQGLFKHKVDYSSTGSDTDRCWDEVSLTQPQLKLIKTNYGCFSQQLLSLLSLLYFTVVCIVYSPGHTG